MTLRPEYTWGLVGVIVCAVVALFISFQMAVFMLLFALVAWWTWSWYDDALTLLIVLLPILPMLKITQTIGTLTLLKDVIILTLFARLVGWPLLQKKLPYRRNILLGPCVALCVLVLVNIIRADSTVLGILRARDIILYMILYAAVLYFPVDARALYRRAKWFFASVFVALILAGYQWFFAVDSAVLRFDPVQQVWIPRLSSTLAHPSIFGQYLVTFLALVLALLVVVRERSWRFLGGLITVATSLAIFLTYSRAVWLGFVVVCAVCLCAWLVLYVSERFSRRVVVMYGTLSLIILGIVSTIILSITPAGGLLRSSLDPTYGSNVERLDFLARLVAPMTNMEAVIGRGLGDVIAQNFREVDVRVVDVAAADARAVQQAKNRTLVDNQYLKTWVEMGLLGILVYGWICWRLCISMALSLRDNTKILRVVSLWGLAFLSAFIVQGFFIDIWEIFPTNALFWIIAGLFSARLSAAQKFRLIRR